MAKQLNVNLAFTADTTQAKAQLQQLQNQLNSLVKGQGISDSHLGITKDIQEGINAAAQLKVQLEAATNVNTGKLDLTKFSRSLKASGMDLKTYAKQLEQLGPAGTDAFLSLSRAISNAEAPLVRINKHVAQLGTTLANTVRWQLSSGFIHSLQSGFQTIIRYAEDLNTSLNEIRIVTGQNVDQMAKFAKEANKAAKALSTTTTEYTNASLIYYQQGLSDAEVKKRTDITIKMANVAGESAETVSNQLTAVWNNFYDGTKSLEYYADVMTALGAATASSVDEISGGLEKFAAIGETIGLSYEYAASALATITSNTRQSEEVVGTALKTIFARIQGLNLGETLEDGTTLNKYSEALAKTGISIFEANGQLKSMDNILTEMAAKWDTLNNSQQTALAQTVAGVRQYTQLVALMENWDNGDNDSMMANLDTSYGATGALQAQADIYAESWEAASDRVKAAAETIYDTLINDETIIDLMDVFSDFLGLIDKLINALGGVPGLLALISTAALKLAGPSISGGIYNLVQGAKTFFSPSLVKSEAQEQKTQAWKISAKMAEMQGGNLVSNARADAIKNEAKLQSSLLKYSEKLTEEQKKIYALYIDSVRAIQDENIERAKTITQLEEETKLIQQKDLYQTNSKNKNEKITNSFEESKKLGSYIFYEEQLNKSNIDENGVHGPITTKTDLLKLLKHSLPEDKAENLATKVNQLDHEKLIEEDFKTIVKEIKNALREAIEESKKTVEDTTNDLYKGKNSKKKKQQFEKDNAKFRELGYTEASQEYIADNLNAFPEEFEQQLEEGVKTNKKWSDSLVEVAGNVSYFAMGLNSLTNSFNSVSESIKEGTFEFNDLLTVLMSLGMSIPMLLNSITALTDGTKLGSIVTAVYAKIKGVETEVLKKNAQAQKAANIYLLIAVVAITLIIKALSALIKTRKEAQESIQDSINKYQEEKDKLDELNNSLDETKNRIKELSEQDTLTLVEQEELEKLKLQNKYLERQIELQEKATKEANKEKVETTLGRFSYAYGKLATDTSSSGTGSGGIGGWGAYSTEDEDFLATNLEKYQEAEDAYFESIQAIIFDGVEYLEEDLLKTQDTLKQLRQKAYTEAEYKTTFIDPLLETTKVDYSGDAIFDIMASGDANAMQNAEAIMSKQLENELKLAGISIEEFLNYIASLTNETKKKISEDVGIPLEELDEYTKDFTQEDWQILASLNIENIDTADQLWAAFEKYRETAINVEVVGIEELNQILEQLNNSQKPLETALSSYSDKGYLTMDEVQELISENPEYSKYVMYDAINDRYKLIGQTLTDFKNLEAKEKQALNELLDLNKEQNQLNTDYLNEYVGMLDALQESSDFSYLNNNYQELKIAAENYQQGNLSTSQYLEDVGKNIDTIIDQYSQLTEDMANGDETADELEAALTSVTGMLANGLMDLNKQFQAGTITMQDYYSGTISGTKSLINSYQGLYKNIIKTADGTYKLKDSVEQATDEERQAVDQLNLWQKQIDNANDMEGVISTLTANYDYLIDYADAFGQIDFNIDNNFDTTAQQFQNMCNAMQNNLIALEDQNEQSYKNILKYVQAQGFTLAQGLETSADTLAKQMSEDADLAGAVVNACMEETGGVITSVSQAAGTILSELGELIANFEYQINFTVEGGKTGWLWDVLSGKETKAPTIKITGSGGENISDFTTALSQAASFLSSQGSGMGQGGIFDYGDEGYDGSALNPNSIITDNLNSSQDDAFERLQDKLKLKLQIDEDELERLEYFINKMSDDFYLLGESAEKLWETFEYRENILETHKAHIADLTAAYNVGQISAEDYNSGLEESKDAIYEQLNALLDLDKQMKEYYGNTLDEADTELEDHTDHLSHLSKVFDHYVNLMDIFGKSKDYDAMGNFLQGQADVIKNELDVIEDYYDGLLKEKDEVEKLLADAVARGDKEAQELYEIMLDDITDKVDETQDKMLEMTEEWGEAMKKVFENTFNKLSDELEKALTDGMGFESMLDDFDLLNQQQEEFLTKTNQIYETNKLMRTINKSIDETSNKASKIKLKSLADETKKLQETTRLSKYELEVQQAKYDLLLAEIALEEAQNAKSTVRLTRDNEGNFGYVYTADQDEVDNAQQQLEDAQNNLYNIQYEGQQNALTKYVEALYDYKNAVEEVEQNRLDGKYASEEEYRDELARLEDAYYGPTGILTELARLYNITLQENTNATAENMLNQYGFMTDGVEQHATLVQQFIGDMDVAWNEFQNALTQVHDEVQTALGNSEQATKDLTDEGKTLADSIKKDIVPAIHDEIGEVRNAVSAYGLQVSAIDSLIKKYEDYIDTLERVAIAEGNADAASQEKQQDDTTENERKNTTYQKTAVDEMWDRNSNPVTNYYTPAGDIARSAEAAEKQRNVLVPTYNYENGKFTKSVFGSINSSFIDNDGKGSEILEVKDGYYLIGTGAGKKWIKSSDILRGFDTGGYTGDWGPEGKLAMLHEKELVLNASDTENILSAVSMIREIVNAIDSRAQMASLMTMSSVSNIASTGQTLEQSVMIEASFPNATDRYEIEEAFNSLVNKASQYANRK